MTRPTHANPAGVNPFDHGELARLPEYHAARKALEDLAHALNREEIDLGQAAWLRTVKEMAASTPYADCCNACMRRGNYEPRYPCRVEIVGDGLKGFYRCPECGNTWTCGWSVDAPAWMARLT